MPAKRRGGGCQSCDCGPLHPPRPIDRRRARLRSSIHSRPTVLRVVASATRGARSACAAMRARDSGWRPIARAPYPLRRGWRSVPTRARSGRSSAQAVRTANRCSPAWAAASGRGLRDRTQDWTPSRGCRARAVATCRSRFRSRRAVARPSRRSSTDASSQRFRPVDASPQAARSERERRSAIAARTRPRRHLAKDRLLLVDDVITDRGPLAPVPTFCSVPAARAIDGVCVAARTFDLGHDCLRAQTKSAANHTIGPGRARARSSSRCHIAFWPNDVETKHQGGRSGSDSGFKRWLVQFYVIPSFVRVDSWTAPQGPPTRLPAASLLSTRFG